VLRPDDIDGKRVLEVGSYNVNGTLRQIMADRSPAEYVGVDIMRCDHTDGPCLTTPCVDRLCDVKDLLAEFGPESFDVVICTEMLEHVRDWAGAIHNLKGVLRGGGLILLTTRSPGFPPHSFPDDHWRFTVANMAHVFSDCRIEHVGGDPEMVGVFVAARKPEAFEEADLSTCAVYAMAERDNFFYVAARDEEAPSVKRACGRLFFETFEDAKAHSDRLNAAAGCPYFGVIEGIFEGERYKARRREAVRGFWEGQE
jgi:SAM-dependent methyltransferase